MKDYQPVERALCRIPEVSGARIVADGTGRPREVHILASTTKTAKQIVRDVESVALTAFGVELDHRMVSVVQFEDDPEAPRPSRPRITLDAVTLTPESPRATATVRLRRNEETGTGEATGLLTSTSGLRLVADAALAALRQIEPAAALADVESTSIVRIGDRDLAVAVVVFLVAPYDGDSEEPVSGSALVRPAGHFDAVVRAVLDATNRRLGVIRI